ncbi:hypothetical protein TRAPUB_12794 [Trametes pubescens]|uniref:N-acetyltransferase domain-containing protein n=1 Tax=Trametes pubescens TaxID=154538 RepID=A0A1M2VSX0_TRAPU|nr:hypothetical protein TRAPUB_12794 [Trametes pubescens]
MTESRPTTPPSHAAPPTPPTPGKTLSSFGVLAGRDVSDDFLKECSALFSQNYGVWAANVPPPLKPGASVKMSAAKLRKDCLSDPENSLVVFCYVKSELVGHAFVTKWLHGEGYIGWVTQLVVDRRQCRRFIATSMLQNIKNDPWFDGVVKMGMVTSHPSACNALCKLLNLDAGGLDIAFIREHAASVLACSPVKYLRAAELRGAFIDPDGAGSCEAFTSFYVDHTEPLQALEAYVERGRWVLGHLQDGHEFVIILPCPPTLASSVE